jgi:LCP family protein required for cell wall assembly
MAIRAQQHTPDRAAVEGTTTSAGGVTTVTGQGGSPVSFPAADPHAKNILIVGANFNACVDPNSPWAGAAAAASDDLGTRADTIMVVRVDPTRPGLAVLSFPRDLWVQIPGRGKQRISSAYVKNDYSLLAQTLYNNFGVTVDHYVQIDFCAFTRIVNAIGGVAVPFTTPVRDRNVGLIIPSAGCHTFSGDEALAYVRSRHLAWIDDTGAAHEDRSADVGRISRQQDFLLRVLEKSLKTGLVDPPVTEALIRSLQTDIVTDQGFTLQEMMKLAGVLQGVGPLSVGEYQIEGKGITVGGNAVLAPQLDSPNMRAVLAIFTGAAPVPGDSDQTATTSTPASGAATQPPQPSALEGDIIPDPRTDC